MEQPQQTSKGKENLSDFEDDLLTSQSCDPSLLQLIDLKVGKRLKTKSKYQKPSASGIRPGDWVCLICSNLNFSFRNECNRCQMQTKRQNYLETLQLFSENRKLEKDLTSQNYPDLPDLHKKSKSTSIADLCLDLNLIPPPGFETYSQGSLDSLGMDSDYCTNSGFESVILLTPPKINKNKERLHCREGSELDFLPYKSPQKLPSVSPILKNILKEDLNKKKTSSVNAEGYCFEKAFNFISEAFCYEEYDPCYLGSEDETNDSANTGRKMSSDEQEEAEEGEMDSLTENMLQELQLSFIDEYPTVEEINKGNCRNVGKCELSVEKKGCEEKKPKKERKSDWICVNCGNLNYSFRKYCNRCQIIR